MVNYALENTLNQVRRGNSVNSTFDLSNHKIIIYSDNIVRIKNYEFPIFYNFNGSGGRRKKNFYDDLENGGLVDMDIRRKTVGLVIKTIYGLANKNFTRDDSKFLTLVSPDSITDVQEANKYFKKFIRKMKIIYGDFEYLAVIQFQGNGRVHHHIMINIPYIPHKRLLEIWGNGKGSVFIRKIYSVDNLGAYLLKYMDKSIGDKRLLGNKAYLCSKGLKRPVERYLSDFEYKELMHKYDLENRKIAYKKSYQTENYGFVEELEYNLSRK